jgi:tetratricopeptide (TPR) repeat protein
MTWMQRSFLISLMAGLAGVATADNPALDTAALLARAWDDYRLEEFSPARFQFGELSRRLPKGSDDQKRALFGLATTLANQRPEPDRPAAKARFEELIAIDGKGDLAAWAWLGLARLKHVVPVGETPDVVAVRAAYQEVLTRFPDHPAAEEAFIYQQSTLVAGLKPDETRAALAALQGFITAHPKARFLSAAWALVAECQRTLNQPEARLAAEIRSLETLEIDPTNPYMDKASQYWRIATVAEFEAGDFRAARKYYALLIKDYPTDQRKYGAKAALARMDATERKLRGGG